MINVPEQLIETANRIHNHERTRAVKVRKFIGWFGAQRRGLQVTTDIRSALKKVKLVTEPDFVTANIEGLIRFKPAATRFQRPKPNREPIVTEPIVDESDETIEQIAQVELSDPTPRLGTLFGNRKPVSVTRQDKLTKALTLMVKHDYSQLPVMTGSRQVDGIVSWRTIGDAALLHKKACQLVEDCLEKEGYEILNYDCALPKALKTIADNELVLVRDAHNEIVGVVTHYDLAERYHTLAEPFLLLFEIETNLRQMIVLAKFPLAQLKAAKDPKDNSREVKSVSDLTFGEYVRLLNDPDNWKQVHLNLSRSEFMSEISGIATIRNEVMHFAPDPLERGKLEALRRAAQMMRKFKLYDKRRTAVS